MTDQSYFLGNQTRGRLLLERVVFAASRWDRARGLFWRRIPDGSGLWFAEVAAVHTFGLRQGVDVFFIDGMRVTACHHMLARRRVCRAPDGMEAAALITRAGTIDPEHLREGDRLEWVPRTSFRIDGGAKPWCEELLPAGMRIDVENRRLVEE